MSPPFALQCPLPGWEEGSISLAHGGGGKPAADLLRQGVLALLGNPHLQPLGDGAELALEGRIAVSTDSFVVAPRFFPGGNIGHLAVHGTVNDLAMCGARPRYLSLAMILEEGLPMAELYTILQSIREACEACGVQVVTGDTKVVERGKGDGIFLNTTGLGQVHPRAQLGAGCICPGDRVLLSGPMARHGMTILSLREGLQFQSALSSDTRPLHEPVASLLDALGPDLHMLRDPTRGGVASVLNEIAAQAGLSIELEQEALPLDEAAASACELLGLDPLYVANEGLFLALVAPQRADEALALLRSWEHGKQAAIIGQVMPHQGAAVLLRSAFGGRRVLPLLRVDQLPRIC
jgi:hydrogenase expression/formation protein HypE